MQFQHGQYEHNQAAEFFKNTDAYKRWVYRGNWYRALADGFWTYLDDATEFATVRQEWRDELRLENMVDEGAKLAQQFITEILKEALPQ